MKAEVTNVFREHPDGVRYLVRAEGHSLVEVIRGYTGLLSINTYGGNPSVGREASKAVKEYNK